MIQAIIDLKPEVVEIQFDYPETLETCCNELTKAQMLIWVTVSDPFARPDQSEAKLLQSPPDIWRLVASAPAALAQTRQPEAFKAYLSNYASKSR